MSEQDASRSDPGHDRQTVLVTAASLHGATAEIAEAIGKTLAEHGFATSVIPPSDVRDAGAYDAVILGSAVYVGHWLKAAKDFANRHRSSLAARRVWLFSSGPVGEPSGKLAQAMAKDPVELPEVRAATGAQDHQMFAGRLDRKSLSPLQRAVLLAFPGLNGDFRDWAAISKWAEDIARQLAAADGSR